MIAFKNILVATDFSEPSRSALEYGKALARSHGAVLHVLHVIERIPTYYGSEMGLAVANIEQSIEDTAVRELDSAIGTDDVALTVRRSAVRAANVVAGINDYAGAHAVDLIVVGTHGRGGVSRFLMGSVADRIVRSAPSPVLTVHAHEPHALSDEAAVHHETTQGAAV